jgi:UDP-N-acetylglucosamine pyrophosphorylase
MTSRENNEKTTSFFKRHNYFDMGEENVKFFIQNEFPMIDTKGKVLVGEDGLVKKAADGHGGIFEAMRRNGIIEDMQKRKIEWIFIAGVDNVLAKMVDPVLTGIAIEKNCLAAGKSVVKNSPKEHVGVFCKKDGRPSVIEYTEITDEMAEATDKNGELLYGESHILCNLFNIKAIEEIAKNKLPYHSAFKKARYIDTNGVIVVPESPNAYKFEAFIFDAFERLDNMAVMRVKREEEFAPVKNAEGEDSPETARKLYLDYIKNRK